MCLPLPFYVCLKLIMRLRTRSLGLRPKVGMEVALVLLINHLIILPQLRNLGIGSKLLGFLKVHDGVIDVVGVVIGFGMRTALLRIILILIHQHHLILISHCLVIHHVVRIIVCVRILVVCFIFLLLFLLFKLLFL